MADGKVNSMPVCHYCGASFDLSTWTSAAGYAVPACRDVSRCTARAERRLAARINERGDT